MTASTGNGENCGGDGRLRRAIGAAWGRGSRGRVGEMEEGGQGFKKEGESGSLMALTPGLKRGYWR